MADRYHLEALMHDGPLRWRVTSKTRPDVEHVVDLAGFGGIGSCSCEHFQFRIAPELREGKRFGAKRCSHIIVAREAFCDAFVQVLIQRQKPS